MRRFAAALAVLLSIPATAQQEIAGLGHQEPTAAQDSLRGPVRSVRYLDRTADAEMVTFYDPAGRRTEMLVYLEGDLRGRGVYTYDARGRSTGSEFYDVVRTGEYRTRWVEPPPGTPLSTVPERRVYVLDEAGRRTEVRNIRVDGVQSRSTMAYDSAGRLREVAHFGAGREPEWRQVYWYDDGGRLGEEASLGYGGAPLWRMLHEYDAAGRPRQRRFFDARGTESRTVYGYDERGNQVLSENHVPAGVITSRHVTRYDSAGRRLGEEIYSGDTPRWRMEYRYDAEGRLREEETRYLMPHPPESSSDRQPGKIVYTYQPDGGRQVETFSYGRGDSIDGRVVERFDANGRRVEREEFEPDGTRTPIHVFDPARGLDLKVAGRTRWTEELDAHGNWTRRAYILIPDDGGPPHILSQTVREITYW